MNAEKWTFPLRITKKAYEEYKQITESRGLSINAYLVEALYLYHHPLPKGTDAGLNFELHEIQLKLDQLQDKEATIMKSNDFIREQAAGMISQVKNKDKLVDRIMVLLRNSPIPLSELTIASEISEDADMILVVCSYMEKRRMIKHTGDFKWSAIA